MTSEFKVEMTSDSFYKVSNGKVLMLISKVEFFYYSTACFTHTETDLVQRIDPVISK